MQVNASQAGHAEQVHELELISFILGVTTQQHLTFSMGMISLVDEHASH